MRKLLLLMAIAGAAAVGSSNSVLDACGSKFLVGARSARYQRLQATLHPANILWYYEDDENAAQEEGWDPDNLEPLLKVGHTITRARDAQELREAVRDESFDIVIMGLDKVIELGPIVHTLSPESVLLPSLEFPTRPEYSRAKREYGEVLKLPTTMDGMLSTLDRAQRTSAN